MWPWIRLSSTCPCIMHQHHRLALPDQPLSFLHGMQEEAAAAHDAAVAHSFQQQQAVGLPDPGEAGNAGPTWLLLATAALGCHSSGLAAPLCTRRLLLPGHMPATL